jgi:FMN phosphatase YigB (HAD superfamily)
MKRAVLLDLNGVVEDTSGFTLIRDDLVTSVLSGDIEESVIKNETANVRGMYEKLMAHSVPEFHLMFWDDLLERLGLGRKDGLLFSVYERFVDEYLRHSRVFADVFRLLRNHAAEVDFGLLSNANSLRARRFIEHHALRSFFKTIVVSHDTPYEKPAREVFLLAAHRLGRHPSDVIMVGDRLDNDVVGAQQVGMTGILLNRSGDDFPEFAGFTVISDLEQLPRLIDSEPNISQSPVSDATVVIVCGGQGTRLKAYTHGIQKCLTSVRGKPILLHTMDVLVVAGMRRFDLIAGGSASEVEQIVSAWDVKGKCKIRVLPISEAGTARAVQVYWKQTRGERRDLVYSHGNIILEESAVARFLRHVQYDRTHGVIFLASPLWVAQTHAGLMPVRGEINRIVATREPTQRDGLCSVGLAFVRNWVELETTQAKEDFMFEELIEVLRKNGHVSVGYQYSDAPWEHLGVPADWQRLDANARR